MIDPGVLVAIAIPTGGGLIAWGTLRQQVQEHSKEIESKASKDVVDAHYDAILQRLERIERKLDTNGNGKHT